MNDTQRIFDKLDMISTDIAVLKAQMPDADKRLEDHERRLRSIEARLWTAVGIMALLTFAVPIILSLVGLP